MDSVEAIIPPRMNELEEKLEGGLPAELYKRLEAPILRSLMRK
ncbi:hypothetical protein [Thermococcus sp. JCM 11816]